MNQQKIESCVIKAKRGDNESLLIIFETFKPFIFKIAKSYNINSYDTYDLVQSGYVALINAVDKYKIGSHTFSPYAFVSIKNSMRYLARTNMNRNSEISLNQKINLDNSNDEFIDTLMAITDVEDDFIKLENSKNLRKAVSKLPPDELELILFVYYNDVSLKTYAEKKGMSYSKAVWKKNKILEKIKENLKEL
ncbi:MAG: sigma-70 family RNA polymerase sigma factor [Clostridiaceae bacterium]